MSSFKELTDKANKLLNPPWYKKFMKVDYYSVAELFDQASKITKEQKEKVDCLLQAGKCYDLAGCKFDSAESYFTLYKCTNKKEYLVKSCYQFYDINAFSIAATRMGEYVESVFQRKSPIVKENKLFLYDDLNFILKCYDQANMPISSRKYYYYKGYLLFIDNKTEDCKECFKLAYKKELVDFINGKKEDFLASDWMEEEIKSKSKILLDIL